MAIDGKVGRSLKFRFSVLLLCLLGVAFAGGALASAPTRHATGNSRTVPFDTATPTPTAFPNCGPGSDYIISPSSGAVIDPGTTLVSGSQCDDCLVSVALPFTFDFYGQPFITATLSSNGNVQFVSTTSNFSNTCLPTATLNYAMLPHWDDLDLRTSISATNGIFTSLVGSTPNRTYNIEWRACLYNNPNGPCGGNVSFEVKLYESPVTGGAEFDFVYGSIANNGLSATVGAQRATGAGYSEYSCDAPALSNGLRLSFRPLACGEDTSTPTNTRTPTITPTPTTTSTETATPGPCGTSANYQITQSTGSVSPAVNLVNGSQCDDCTAGIALPFAFRLYGQTYNTVNASSNGNLQFGGSNPEGANICLPDSAFTDTLLPHFDDLNMVNTLTTSLGVPGIYMLTTGTAPNRVFNIEWRACRYAGPGVCGGEVNFQVKLFENSDAFQFVYGTMANGGGSATVGVQNGTGTLYTQFACNAANALLPGLLLTFDQPPCPGTPTPTFTPQATNTPGGTQTPTTSRTRTATRTVTATPSATAVLVGHVTWQGRPPQPDALQQVPITLTLKRNGVETNYSPQTTDANGYFTVAVSALPSGTYDWRVKGQRFLANAGQVAIGGPVSNVEMGLMKAGDPNSDNVVNINDFNIVRNSFGRSLGDPGYDQRADFNGDNIVNITDFNLLKTNFGVSGAPPI